MRWTNGSLSSFNGSTGMFTYTPNSSYSGLDSFTYKVNDGTSDSDVVTVAIAVGGHFGPRTNLEELPQITAESSLTSAMPTSCVANSTPLTFAGDCMTGDLRYAQMLTPSVPLVYNSGTLPKPIVVLETFLQSGSSVPDEIKAKLTFNGTAGTEYTYDTTSLSAGDPLRFALQADATSLATGRYAYTVRLTATVSSVDVTHDYSGHVLVVNRGDSTAPFGRGWQLAGLDQLVSATGGMMLVRSGGDALWFADDGSGGYLKAPGDTTFSTLVENIDGSFTLTDKHGIEANFSSAGLLTSRVDRNDNTTTYTYSSGLLTQISDPFGRDTDFTYTSGQLTSVTDFAGRTASLSYTSGNLTSVTQPDPDGVGALGSPVWDFAYNGTTNLLTQVEDPLNQDTDFTYGSHGRLTVITHADSSTWNLTALQTIGLPTGTTGNSLTATNPLGTIDDEISLDWTFRTDRFGRMIEWNNPMSHKTLLQRNASGLAVKLTEADPDDGGALTSPVTILGYSSLGNLRYQKNSDNSTRTWTYSSTFNQVLTATDELGRVHEYTYDSDGNLTAVEDPAGYVTSYVVNSLGLVTSITTPDPDGAGSLTAAVTELDYDLYGRLDIITYPDSTTREYGYDDADHVISDEDELGHIAEFVYDDLGRLVSATDREAAETTYEYNALGLVTTVTDALGNDTDYSYNSRNRVISVLQADPDGAGSLDRPESTKEYNAVGWVTRVGKPSYFPDSTMDYTYDGAGRVQIVERPVTGDETTYAYDNLGRLIRAIDAYSRTTYFEYNSRGWLTKTTGHDPDGPGGEVGPITQFAYDVAGQKTSVTDPRGFVTSYTYDARGLLVSETLPDPDGTGAIWAPTTLNSYDNVGRLIRVDDALCRHTTYEYDERDRLISVTLPDPDGAGSLTSPEWTFAYDDAGRQTSVTDPLSHVTSYTFDDEGRVLTETLPDPDGAGSLSAPVTTNVYDLTGNIVSVTDPRGNTTSYTYDDLHRVLTITQPDPDGGGSLSAPVTTYTYNGQGAIGTITDPLNRSTTFEYDGLGRRIGVTDHEANETTYEYNDLDLLVKVTLPDPDGAGSLTAPDTDYTYDYYKRLASISDPLNGAIYFTYDKAGNLLSVRDPVQNDTTYAYDNIGRLAIETNELSDSRSFTYDAGGNLTRRVDRNGRIIQFVKDNLDRTIAEEWYSDGTPVPSLSVSTTTEGGVSDEVQRVGYTGMMIMGGTFTLSLGGYTTSALTYNASAATVQTALEGLANIGSGNVSVTKLQNSGFAQEWRLNFQGSLAGTDVGQVTINSASVMAMGGPNNIQATDTTGGGVDEVQVVTLANAEGGTFRLAFEGVITPPLDHDSTATEVETALENLNTVDQVTVTGSAGGPWTVTFAGTHAQTNVAKINGDAANATSGTLERTITYVYDAASRLTSAYDPDSGYDYTYDNLGRVLTVDNDDTPSVPRVILTNAYDAAGNRTSLSASIDSTTDFLNSYTYDTLNRLTRVDQIGQSGGNTVAEKRVDLAYNGLGQFTTIARYKDTDGGTSNEIATANYTYDTLNRLTGLAYQNDSTNLFTPYAYTYDDLSNVGALDFSKAVALDPRVEALARGAVFAGLGRITQMTSADGTTDYTYDSTSQLTEADHSYQSDETYTYDANGNRTMTGYDTGDNNQLLDDGTYTYEYDDEGNRVRREKTSDGSSTEYEWDFRNRLIRVTDKDSIETVTQVIEYTYDVFDRRIARAHDTTSPFDLDDAVIERYVLDDVNGVTSLDGGNVVLDFVDPDGAGQDPIALVRRYLFGNQVDQLLAQENVGESPSAADRVYWPLVDHLQTVRDLYGNDASSATHVTYSSFGLPASGNVGLSRYLFTSREFDSGANHYYSRARWYDSSTGSWISEDPSGLYAGDANATRYVANSPTLYSDPSGQFIWVVPAVAIILILVAPTQVNAPAPPDPVYTPLGGGQLGQNTTEIGIVIGVGIAAGVAGAGGAIKEAADTVIEETTGLPMPSVSDLGDVVEGAMKKAIKTSEDAAKKKWKYSKPPHIDGDGALDPPGIDDVLPIPDIGPGTPTGGHATGSGGVGEFELGAPEPIFFPDSSQELPSDLPGVIGSPNPSGSWPSGSTVGNTDFSSSWRSLGGSLRLL